MFLSSSWAVGVATGARSAATERPRIQGLKRERTLPRTVTLTRTPAPALTPTSTPNLNP
jgi:hypothetical protein